MHELEKIRESKYFYSQMLKEKGDSECFKHNLSAFLSSARSVLQYALKEAKNKSGGQAWYDMQVASTKVVRFFRDKRDFNIHTEPVAVHANISVQVSETLHISESLSVVLRDSQGNIKGEFHSEPDPPPLANNDPGGIDMKYLFTDWPGREDIFTLCDEYLKELDAIIADGKARGLLS